MRYMLLYMHLPKGSGSLCFGCMCVMHGGQISVLLCECVLRNHPAAQRSEVTLGGDKKVRCWKHLALPVALGSLERVCVSLGQ